MAGLGIGGPRAQLCQLRPAYALEPMMRRFMSCNQLHLQSTLHLRILFFCLSSACKELSDFEKAKIAILGAE